MRSEKEIKEAMETLRQETPEYSYSGSSDRDLERSKMISSYSSLVALLDWVLGDDGELPRPHDWS